MSLIRSHANGNDLSIVESQLGTPDETRARRFAAELERDHPAVDHVDPGIGDKVDVWLCAPADGFERVNAPDGWVVDNVGVADTGNACITFAPEGDA